MKSGFYGHLGETSILKFHYNLKACKNLNKSMIRKTFLACRRDAGIAT